MCLEEAKSRIALGMCEKGGGKGEGGGAGGGNGYM